ncbi:MULTISPECIES: sigma-54 dependent transcriptional regulator [unclassified Janthinobacterium]|uniref:sigma-54-dependent transcriptional regulator n=1 Tax=unclassified Janthinobacterium TaxID=2610881 RepID=UPI0016230CEF|nr:MULTISPECIES: sigma-54 dependent transcriptional regulator [unclassified Janthinobacterium]MBB5371746.1 DNA-binding NtrC family response regulator [Janthinobacterium sp. K2C7]MBB5384551.1 DNA-binding NtrC family response regulator [Janthinobacterium sp. K2Li3]MBB5389827.1 DNA-binding NtrC family response regulator [Janthinobacterium sp. K2E3]
MPTVLIIDDNAAVAIALDVLFSLHEIDSLHAASPEEGLALLQGHAIDLVIQDMNFTADTTSGEEGVALFHAIRARHPDLPVILLTAWTQLDAAVELIKSGAADYLAKPWDDRRLIASVQNLLELGQANQALRSRLVQEQRQRQALETSFDLCGMVWQDPATERVVHLACQVARADVSVLISGPNGSGKERIAAIVQANSAVRDGPFVVLNCGAVPVDLIEAELFGAEAGAYTGSTRARDGKFDAADGGTLFLDEIGNLPLAGQMKLLRVLETGRFERLGSNRERHVKVRVISASNADLPAMIRAGTFREDLFYRLNVIELRLPPLAQRPADILVLARHFLGAGKSLDTQAQATLQAYGWPGNVRELKNVMQRASLLTPGPLIHAEELGLPVLRAKADGDAVVAEPDRASVIAALERAQGVVTQAAQELGLSRQALYRRMERLGIDRA